jgi:hypothetical protein
LPPAIEPVKYGHYACREFEAAASATAIRQGRAPLIALAESQDARASNGGAKGVILPIQIER